MLGDREIINGNREQMIVIYSINYSLARAFVQRKLTLEREANVLFIEELIKLTREMNDDDSGFDLCASWLVEPRSSDKSKWQLALDDKASLAIIRVK